MINTEDGNELSNLIEQLADIEHQRWADWQRYVHSKIEKEYRDGELVGLYLPQEFVEGWDRQIKTNYSDLEEHEKDSDREQVRRYLPIIQSNYILKSDVELAKIKTINDICDIACDNQRDAWINGEAFMMAISKYKEQLCLINK